MTTQPQVSIVIPIYNEEELIPELLRRVIAVMNDVRSRFGMESEVVFVNDGSRDKTLSMLSSHATNDARVRIVDLARNFGHQSAIQAGIEHARGEAVVVMDGDLQDPPELIPQFVESWKNGNRVVIAKRRSRAEGGIKGLLFKSFHKMIGKISDLPMETDSGVFGLMDAIVAREVAALKERNRFMPGLRSWVGFEQGIVYYEREGRAAGEPKQTFGRLVKYAFDAIFSFSYKPLRAIWSFGFVVSCICILYAVILVTIRLLGVNVIPGFTTPTVAILFLGGVQLISIGVLGEYLARIYDEVKQRPHYIVKRVIGGDE